MDESVGLVKANVCLVGDSVLDNTIYVFRGDLHGPDVIQILNTRLSDEKLGRAHIVAHTGEKMAQIERQLKFVEADTSVIVMSVGGNDVAAFLKSGGQAKSRCGFLCQLIGFILWGFAVEYDRTLSMVRAWFPRTPIIVCTIYRPNFPWWFRPFVYIALLIVNTRICQIAKKYKAGVLDTWHICNKEEDLVETVEPSIIGGDKIAMNVVLAVKQLKEGVPVASVSVSSRQGGIQWASVSEEDMQEHLANRNARLYMQA